MPLDDGFGPLGWLLALLLILACTSVTKIAVVFGALRVGLSAEAVLPWIVLIVPVFAIAAVISGPAVVAVLGSADLAQMTEALTTGDVSALEAMFEPLLAGCRRSADPGELALWAELSGLDPADVRVVIPAFAFTELREACELAVLVIVPLLAVDLAAAQLVSASGLAITPSPLITLPAKLALFLAVGGFSSLARNLVAGYG